MKKILLFLLLGFSFISRAQGANTPVKTDDCDYSVTQDDNGQEIKSTKDYLVYEKTFGGTSQFIFFSLSNHEGVPVLKFQLLSKSKDFTPAYCLDKTSRIYIQLVDGSIITLINALDEQCSGLTYDSSAKNNIRILTSSFLFTKGSLEELEKSPISFMRVKYSTDMVDYPVRHEIKSTEVEGDYFPDNYFMNYLKCIK